MTADQQKETAADREMAPLIRRSLTKDDTLSTYAQNVNHHRHRGTVTLKCPVRSRREKKAVEAKAVEIAGKDKSRTC